MRYLLGIDQGETQTTAVVVDERGQVVAQCSAQVQSRLQSNQAYPLETGWLQAVKPDADDLSIMLA